MDHKTHIIFKISDRQKERERERERKRERKKEGKRKREREDKTWHLMPASKTVQNVKNQQV